MHAQYEFNKGHFWTSRNGVVLLAFLAIAGFYLVTEHTAHLFGALPFLLLLACPLLHLFMHGGHEEHAGESSEHQHHGAHGGSDQEGQL